MFPSSPLHPALTAQSLLCNLTLNNLYTYNWLTLSTFFIAFNAISHTGCISLHFIRNNSGQRSIQDNDYLFHGSDDNPFQVIFRSLRDSLDFLEWPRFCKHIIFQLCVKKRNCLSLEVLQK